MTVGNKTLNQTTLMILAPLLMLTGIAGFLIPDREERRRRAIR